MALQPKQQSAVPGVVERLPSIALLSIIFWSVTSALGIESQGSKKYSRSQEFVKTRKKGSPRASVSTPARSERLISNQRTSTFARLQRALYRKSGAQALPTTIIRSSSKQSTKKDNRIFKPESQGNTSAALKQNLMQRQRNTVVKAQQPNIDRVAATPPTVIHPRTNNSTIVINYNDEQRLDLSDYTEQYALTWSNLEITYSPTTNSTLIQVAGQSIAFQVPGIQPLTRGDIQFDKPQNINAEGVFSRQVITTGDAPDTVDINTFEATTLVTTSYGNDDVTADPSMINHELISVDLGPGDDTFLGGEVFIYGSYTIAPGTDENYIELGYDADLMLMQGNTTVRGNGGADTYRLDPSDNQLSTAVTVLDFNPADNRIMLNYPVSSFNITRFCLPQAIQFQIGNATIQLLGLVPSQAPAVMMVWQNNRAVQSIQGGNAPLLLGPNANYLELHAGNHTLLITDFFIDQNCRMPNIIGRFNQGASRFSSLTQDGEQIEVYLPFGMSQVALEGIDNAVVTNVVAIWIGTNEAPIVITQPSLNSSFHVGNNFSYGIQVIDYIDDTHTINATGLPSEHYWLGMNLVIRPEQVGNYIICIIATDNWRAGGTTCGVVVVTNHNPYILFGDTQSLMLADSTLLTNFTVGDPDGDPVHLELDNRSSSAQLLETQLRFTPSISDVGANQFCVLAFDPFNGRAKACINVTVLPPWWIWLPIGVVTVALFSVLVAKLLAVRHNYLLDKELQRKLSEQQAAIGEYDLQRNPVAVIRENVVKDILQIIYDYVGNQAEFSRMRPILEEQLAQTELLQTAHMQIKQMQRIAASNSKTRAQPASDEIKETKADAEIELTTLRMA